MATAKENRAERKDLDLEHRRFVGRFLERPIFENLFAFIGPFLILQDREKT